MPMLYHNIVYKNLGSTLNCTQISVPWVGILTPGKITTWAWANYISDERAEKIAIQKRNYLGHKSWHNVKFHTNLGTMSRNHDPREKYILTLGKLHKQQKGQENRNKKKKILMDILLILI